MIINSIVGKAIDSVSGLLDDLHTSDEEKGKARVRLAEVQADLQSDIDETFRAEVDAKKSVMLSEISQDDGYTKRTRPMMLRWCLYAVVYCYPVFGSVSYFSRGSVEYVNLPGEFWTLFLGLASVYMISRGAEKVGRGGKLTGMITGRPS